MNILRTLLRAHDTRMARVDDDVGVLARYVARHPAGVEQVAELGTPVLGVCAEILV